MFRKSPPPTREEKEAKRAAKDAEFGEKYRSAVIQSQAMPYFDADKNAAEAAEYYARRTSAETVPVAEAAAGEGEIPYASLNELLFGTYTHANRRIGLWAFIDRQPDGTLRCAYTNELIETADCTRLVKADEEHCTAQSAHSGSRLHPGTDMHQIFIVTKKANGSRGNITFGGYSTGDEAAKSEGGWVTRSADGKSRFRPFCNVGAVARATLYALAAYRDTWHQEHFTSETLHWLVRHAAEEPVSDWERHRNQVLFAMQGNRNPFVDFPEWALRVNFSSAFRPAGDKKQSRGVKSRKFSAVHERAATDVGGAES